MSIYSPLCEPFIDDSLVEFHVLEQDHRRFLGVVVVCGLGEFVGVFVAGLDGFWVGGPSFHGSGGDVECCCEGGFGGGWSSACFVGQGLVHEFAGYVAKAEVYQLLSRPFAEVLAQRGR